MQAQVEQVASSDAKKEKEEKKLTRKLSQLLTLINFHLLFLCLANVKLRCKEKEEGGEKSLTRKLSCRPTSSHFFSPRLNVSLGHATHQFTDTTMLFFEATTKETLCIDSQTNYHTENVNSLELACNASICVASC